MSWSLAVPSTVLPSISLLYNADLWIPPAKKGVVLTANRTQILDYLLDKLKDDKDKDIVRGMGTYTLECVAIHTSTEYNNALLTNLYRINRVVIKRALKRVMLGWVSDDKITILIFLYACGTKIILFFTALSPNSLYLYKIIIVIVFR
ncbi:hypothetical protein ACJX0J_033685, partial [Zea mays]